MDAKDDALAIVESEVEVVEPAAESIEFRPVTAERTSPLLNESLRQMYAERALKPKQSRQSRGWDIPFGPVYGEAGTTQVLVTQVRGLFRGEKIRATDTASPAGCGTRIMNITVGNGEARILKPQLGSVLTVFAGDIAVEMDPGIIIAVTVSFVESCTFSMNLFGKVLL